MALVATRLLLVGITADEEVFFHSDVLLHIVGNVAVWAVCFGGDPELMAAHSLSGALPARIHRQLSVLRRPLALIAH